MLESIQVFILLGMFAAIVLGTAVGISMYLENSKEESEQPGRAAHLQETLSRHLALNDPSWGNIVVLAEAEGGYPHLLKIALRNLFKQGAVSADEETEIVGKRAKKALEMLEKEEPFEEFPDELQHHLETLRSKFSSNPGDQALLPLTNYLKRHLSEYETLRQRNMKLTYAGLGVGFIGTVLAALQYFNPPH